MADSFTCFAKFGDVLLKLSDEERKTLEVAICEYGFFGNEIELQHPLTLLFELMKDDIDNSKKARTSGSKGGRPKKEKTEGLDNGKKGGGKNHPKKPPSETTPKNQGVKANTIQNSTVHTNTDQKIYSPSAIAKDVISYLNQAANTSFKASSKNTQSLINARTREGFTVDDFKAVIDGRVKAWANDPKMSEYLRPQTLFGTKFESYLNASKAKPKTDEEEWDELFEEYARYERENTTVFCQP